MTNYSEQNLQPGETIDYRGHALHRAAIVFVCLIPVFATDATGLAVVLLLFAIALAISACIPVQTSEYAVTDRQPTRALGTIVLGL
jgi:energy-coupling factor transporter transmembrane protein EcfT